MEMRLSCWKKIIPINDHWLLSHFNDVVSLKVQAEWLSARHGHFETAKLRGSLGLTWLNPRHVLNRLHAINLGKSAHDYLNLLVFELWCAPSIVYSSIQYGHVQGAGTTSWQSSSCPWHRRKMHPIIGTCWHLQGVSFDGSTARGFSRVLADSVLGHPYGARHCNKRPSDFTTCTLWSNVAGKSPK